MNVLKAVKIIEGWWISLPECHKCGSKNLAFHYLCEECYHMKYSDICGCNKCKN